MRAYIPLGLSFQTRGYFFKKRICPHGYPKLPVFLGGASWVMFCWRCILKAASWDSSWIPTGNCHYPLAIALSPVSQTVHSSDNKFQPCFKARTILRDTAVLQAYRGIWKWVAQPSFDSDHTPWQSWVKYEAAWEEAIPIYIDFPDLAYGFHMPKHHAPAFSSIFSPWLRKGARTAEHHERFAKIKTQELNHNLEQPSPHLMSSRFAMRPRRYTQAQEFSCMF